MSKIEIATLKPGTTATGELLVKEASVRRTTTGKLFVDATLTDGRGTINAKIWSWPANTQAPSGVLEITASVGEYAGNTQLVITSYEAGTLALTEFMPTRDYDLDAAWEYLLQSAALVKHPLYSALLGMFVEPLRDQWFNTTAAIGMHHVQAGGLIQHTAEVVFFLRALVDNHGALAVTPNLDLLLTGAILHDIGKLVTYRTNAETLQFEMTDAGRMLEHITVGIGMLENAGHVFKEHKEALLLLKHCVAAHHGKVEFGSPVVPVCMEAYLISVADGLSATLDTFSKAFKETTAPWTKAVYPYNKGMLTPAYIKEVLSYEEDIYNG